MTRPWRIALLLGLFLPPHAEATTIGPVTNPANGHAYYVTHDLLTWAAGEAWATGLGGHLVTINDAAENAWILGNFALENDWYWTGGSDAAVEETFAWVSGDPWAYSNWTPGEPDDDAGIGGGGDFVVIFRKTGQWLDTRGEIPLAGAIAEVPTPTGVDRRAVDESAGALELSAVALQAEVRVRLGLPRETRVQLVVFDVRGRPVRTLHDGVLGAGNHDFRWDETDQAGHRVGSGLYFVSVRAEGIRRTARVAVAR